MDLANSVFKEVFRKNLQFLRKNENFTQNELSLECDFSRSYVGKIERGDVDPSLESIQRIAEVLDVNPVLLFVPMAVPSSDPSELGEQSGDAVRTRSVKNSSRANEGSLEFLSNQVMNYYQHFEEFYEDAPFGDLLVNPEGEILHANQTFQKFVNAEVPNHSLKDFESYIHPSDQDSLQSFLEKAFSGEADQETVLKFLRKPEGSFIGYISVHQVESPESGLLPECDQSTGPSTCSGKKCARLLVLDVSQLPTNSHTQTLN